MRINFPVKAALVAAMFCLTPAVLPASSQVDQSGGSGDKLNQAASPGDIPSMLQQIRSEADRTRDNADQLEALFRLGPLNDWQADADLLARVRTHVNKMNDLLTQLRLNRAEASPMQRKIIKLITPASLELVSATQDAIVTLRRNENRLELTDLNVLARDIYREAGRVYQATENPQGS